MMTAWVQHSRPSPIPLSHSFDTIPSILAPTPITNTTSTSFSTTTQNKNPHAQHDKNSPSPNKFFPSSRYDYYSRQTSFLPTGTLLAGVQKAQLGFLFSDRTKPRQVRRPVAARVLDFSYRRGALEAPLVRRANFYYWLSVIWNDHWKEGNGLGNWEDGYL